MPDRKNAKILIWSLVAVLIILHHDVWFWDDPTLVFGFLPITLLWHMGISTAAAVVWFLAVKLIWPFEHEPTKIDDSTENVAS